MEFQTKSTGIVFPCPCSNKKIIKGSNQLINKPILMVISSSDYYVILCKEYYYNDIVGDELSGRVSYTFFLIVRLVNIPCNPKQRSF